LLQNIWTASVRNKHFLQVICLQTANKYVRKVFCYSVRPYEVLTRNDTFEPQKSHSHCWVVVVDVDALGVVVVEVVAKSDSNQTNMRTSCRKCLLNFTADNTFTRVQLCQFCSLGKPKRSQVFYWTRTEAICKRWLPGWVEVVVVTTGVVVVVVVSAISIYKMCKVKLRRTEYGCNDSYFIQCHYLIWHANCLSLPCNEMVEQIVRRQLCWNVKVLPTCCCSTGCWWCGASCGCCCKQRQQRDESQRADGVMALALSIFVFTKNCPVKNQAVGSCSSFIAKAKQNDDHSLCVSTYLWHSIRVPAGVVVVVTGVVVVEVVAEIPQDSTKFCRKNALFCTLFR